MAITWPQIGSQSFVSLAGDLDPQGDTLQEITREGVDGSAFRKVGKRGFETVLTGVAIVSTSSAANALMTSYKALQATIVSITQAEQGRANYLILSVDILDRKEIATPSGGVYSDGSAITGASSGWLVVSRWAVRYVGT